MRLRKEKWIIVAFDMANAEFALNLVWNLRGVEGNFATKVGRSLEMQTGIEILAEIKYASGLPVIYNDKIAYIPYISQKIAEYAYECGCRCCDSAKVCGF